MRFEEVHVPAQLRLSRAAQAALVAEVHAESEGLELDHPRPCTRGDCKPGGMNAERPCPYVGCRYHLFLEVNALTGEVKANTDLDPWDMPETCILDLVDRCGEYTLEEIGKVFDLTRERIRQIELNAREKLAAPLMDHYHDAVGY